MSKNSTAKKAQETEDFVKSHLFVVTPATKPEDVEFQEVKPEQEEPETVDILDVIKKVNAEYINGERVLPSELARREAAEVENEDIRTKPVQSIEEIKRKSEVLSRLSVKWDNLTEKRRKVENFSISHDGDTASAIIRDSQGEVFESNSPKTIAKLIEFWKAEFSAAIQEIEKEMREIA